MWSEDKILKEIKNLDCKIEVISAEGDIDTNNILLTAKGAKKNNQLWLCGIILPGIKDPNTNEEIYNNHPDFNNYIKTAVLTDGQDSSGGLNTDDLPTGILYQKIKNIFNKKFPEISIINSDEEYY